MGSVIEVDFKSKKRNDALTAAMLASGLDTPPEVLALFYEAGAVCCDPQTAYNVQMSSRIIGNVTDTAPCEMISWSAPDSDPA